MDVEHAFQNLIQKVLNVCSSELGQSHRAVEVAVEELEDQVQVLEVGDWLRSDHDVEETDDVFVRAKVRQDADLSQNALGVHEVGEDVSDLLDGDFHAGDLVNR
mmetsp:Transcript_42170/g.61841  ORF Transcript_42170/g.61841 Transcript_42170/m.61841 type:complete len:104 (-) Transcript_42170:388-699(-)